MQKKKCLVVDLDETLLSINTFPYFVKFVCKLFLKKLKIHTLISLAILLAARKTNIITHSALKKKIIYTSLKHFPSHVFKHFADKVDLFTNKEVLKIINFYKQRGYYICLATAAPDLYAEHIFSIHKFDFLVCTKTSQTKENWVENIRNIKLINVEDLCNKHNLSLSIVLTDHSDDYFLMAKTSEKNFLVNPSHKTIKLLADSNITFEIVNS